MKKTYKTIRLSEEVYELLCDYRQKVEQVNSSRISLDDAVDMALGQDIMYEHFLSDEKARFNIAANKCTCGAFKRLEDPTASNLRT